MCSDGSLHLLSANPCPLMTFPAIREKLGALRECKQGQYKLALTKLRELGSTLSDGAGLPPIALGRAQFIWESIQNTIKDSSGCDEANILASVILEITNLKNALQVEAVFFGGVYGTIEKHFYLHFDPSLSELIASIPEIFECIQTQDLAHTGLYKINLEHLEAYFDEAGVASACQLFDNLMLKSIASYQLSEDKKSITIPVGGLPSKSELQPYLRSSDLLSRRLAEILFIFITEEEIVCSSQTNYALANAIMGFIEQPCITQYTRKRALLPYLSSLIEANLELKGRYRNSISMLTSSEFIRKIYSTSPFLWLDDSADTFELIRNIECYIRKTIPIRSLTKVDEVIFSEGADENILSFGDHLRTFKRGKNRFIFPLSKQHPFCTSKEEFYSLAFSHCPIQHSTSDEPELSAVAVTSAAKKKPKEAKPHVKKPTKEPKSAIVQEATHEPVLYSGSGCKAYDAEEVDLSKIASRQLLAQIGVHCSGKRSSKASPIDESIIATREFLSDVGYEKRVSDFWKSEELGLSHRDDLVSSDLGYAEKVEQFVKTHDFPKGLLLFACNPLYSTSSVWGNPGRLKHNNFASVVYIDGIKHKLTVTLNRIGKIYHLYAAPITKWRNYFEQRAVELEADDLAPAQAPEPLNASDSRSYSLDASANATFVYKGRTITIIKLA
jgi:hypothetical protein